MPSKPCIAIDGPAGAGKSTIARLVADRLGYIYIDTGAMYRAVTLAALRRGVCVTDEPALTELAENCRISFTERPELTPALRVYLDGDDVTLAIRSPEVGGNVSPVAVVPGVRHAMVRLQREMAGCGGVVLDGRDIGTYVLPDAEYKFFLTADVGERARRRHRELVNRGVTTTYEAVEKEVRDRDYIDSHREMAPLRQADDAIVIDSTSLTVEQVVEAVLGRIREG